jgi:hypothetical protein
VRILTVVLLAIATSGAASLQAQDRTFAQSPNKQPQFVTTQDGGVSEVLQSIEVPPKAGAPFTLTLETEWVKTLNDGGTVTFVNKRRIARDAAGRIYQERWALVPKNDPHVKSMMTVIQIADPTAGTLYNCFLVVKTNTCELLKYTGSTSKIYKPASPPSGPLPNNQGTVVHQELGAQILAGVSAEGIRDVTTYNPGVFGNDRKVTIEREFWYSEQLGLSLLSVREDPRIGKQTFVVTSVNQSDPDSSLFELPAGFKTVDLRETAPPQPN